MLIFKMAFRNILRQKKRSVFTALSMFGGFVLAVVFIGWADGSYNNIIDTFTRTNFGHIQIHEKSYLDRPSLYKTIDNLPEIEKLLGRAEHIDSWAPRLYAAGLAAVGKKSAGTKIIGILPQKEIETTKFNKKIIKGHSFSLQPDHEVILGKGLAKVLKAKLNEKAVIVSQAADGSIANDIYRIIGILETGDQITDRSSFYLHLKDAQELMVMENRIHEVAITVSSLGNVRPVNNFLTENLNNTNLTAEPWQIFAKTFYIAMKADMEGLWISLFVIILVVAVGVLNTVLMMVLERRREYGILKAVGTKPFQIIKLVLAEMNLLALFSIIFGIVVGFLINSILSTHGIALSEPISWGGMQMETLKTEVNLRSFIIPAITIFLSATIVSFFPSLKAAHTEPAKTMRMH